MKKKSPKLVATLVAVLTFANVFSLTGCGKTENTGSKAEQEVSFEISKIEQEVTSAQTDASVQTDVDTAQTQTDEQGVGTGGIMRAYSDKEKERMAGLQQSYQNETAKPEQMIQEVDSAEDVTEGTLCYIVSTGEYYLPDRELTDEELLEIIDCNFRISLNTNRKTQAEYEAEDRAKRAELEAKVKQKDCQTGQKHCIYSKIILRIVRALHRKRTQDLIPGTLLWCWCCVRLCYKRRLWQSHPDCA